MHFEILVEDLSGKKALDILMPKIIGNQHTFRIIAYRGIGHYIEVQTGRGKMDLLITHNQRKYIVETKIWRGEVRYQAGKQQLAAYIRRKKLRRQNPLRLKPQIREQ